jgi:tetratricopeptide (TPR) repeat protein
LGLKDYDLGAKEGVLLHLWHINKFRDDYTSPKTATQPGIASKLGIQRSYVSYILSNLISKDLAYEQVAHVEGERRKKKVFFLTDQGFLNAKDMVESLRKKKIEFIFNNEVYEKDLDGVQEVTGLRLEEIIIRTDPRTRNNFDTVEEPEVEPEPAPPVIRQPLPEVKNFVGRTEEIQEADNWLTGPSKVLTIYGIAGQGKTALVSQLMNKWDKNKTDFFYHKTKVWGSEMSLFTDVALYLKELKRPRLAELISEKGSITMEDFFYLMNKEMQTLDLGLVIDDLQEFSDKDRMNQLIRMLVDLDKIKLILLSRDSLDLTDPRQKILSKSIEEIRLGGLTKEEVDQYLELEKIDTDEDVFGITKGHPLFLNLFSHFYTQEGSTEAQRSIREFITGEVIKKLSREERDVLDIISLCREGANERMLSNLDSKELYFSPESIWHLVDYSLLDDREGVITIHSLVSEICIYLQSAPRRKRIHSILYDHYNEMSESYLKPTSELGFEDILEKIHVLKEMLYHHSRSADPVDQLPLLAELGEELSIYSETDELLGLTEDLLRSIDTDDQEQVSDLGRVMILNGWCHTLKGNWNKAHKTYEQALDLSKEYGLTNLRGRCENALGTIHLRKGDIGQAMTHIEDALKLLKTPLDISKAQSNLAVVHWQKGDLPKALELIDQALKTSRELKDATGISRALTNKGIILWQMDKHDSSLQSYTEAMEICITNRFSHTISQLCDNIGEVHRSKGDTDKAREYFQKSLEMAQELGFKWQIGDAKKNLALVAGSDKERTVLLNEAKGIYKELGANKECDEIDVLLKG